jgi:hypothetical protein
MEILQAQTERIKLPFDDDSMAENSLEKMLDAMHPDLGFAANNAAFIDVDSDRIVQPIIFNFPITGACRSPSLWVNESRKCSWLLQPC